MAQATYPTVPDYVKNNLIIPLNSYIKRDLSSKDLNDIYPRFLKRY